MDRVRAAVCTSDPYAAEALPVQASCGRSEVVREAVVRVAAAPAPSVSMARRPLKVGR